VKPLSEKICSWTFGCLLALVGQAFGDVALPGHGTVSLSTNGVSGWSSEIRRTDAGTEPEVFEVGLTVRGAAEGIPPRLDLRYEMEQRDVQLRWSPENVQPPVPWQERMGRFETRASGQVPVLAWLSQTDENRLTVACSETLRPVLLAGYERDIGGSKVVTSLTFFPRGGVPLKDYSARVRFDFRPRPYWETVREGSDWVASRAGGPARAVPEAAYEPLWNSWYGYHTGYSASDMEREGRLAASLGIRTLLYDMGWDRVGTTNTQDFAQCGDWQPDPVSFPNLKEHLARMHDLGLRCILWGGVPLMGEKARNLERFRPFLLTSKPTVAGSCHVLDPRFPQVRKFISETLVRGVAEWGVDGWKVDFIQQFADRADDPVGKTGLGGRDCRWVADAARRVQEDFAAKVRDVRPDAMFEFMFPYGGIFGQRISTQVRAADCPGDAVWNRSQTARLLLLCGNRVAVHSDMLTWSREETPEACAVQVISVLHSVIQCGMRLTDLTPDQAKMLAHWLSFAKSHRETLLKGAFRPHGPAFAYPLLEMESPSERIVTVHQPGLCVRTTLDRSVCLVNGTDASGLAVELDSSAEAILYDTYGRETGARRLEPGLVRLAVPRAGYVKLVRTGSSLGNL